MGDLDNKARELTDHVHAVVLQQRALEALAAADPELELNRQELLAVEILGDGGSSIMRALAQKLYLAGNTVTTLVDNLEKKSIVRRVRDQTDRRLIWVELTNNGDHVYRALVEERLRLCRSLLAALTEDEQEIYLVLMRKIARAAHTFVATSPHAEGETTSAEPTTASIGRLAPAGRSRRTTG